MSSCTTHVAEGEFVRVDGPCKIRFIGRKSKKMVSLRIESDVFVKVTPQKAEMAQVMPHEQIEDFCNMGLATDTSPVV